MNVWKEARKSHTSGSKIDMRFTNRPGSDSACGHGLSPAFPKMMLFAQCILATVRGTERERQCLVRKCIFSLHILDFALCWKLDTYTDSIMVFGCRGVYTKGE